MKESDVFLVGIGASLVEEGIRVGFVARCRKAVFASRYLDLVSEDARKFFSGMGFARIQGLACQRRSADMVVVAVDSLVCPD